MEQIRRLAMKEHPILFSTPMVQAICDRRKTMTRRKLKVKGCKPFSPKPEEWTISEIEKWNEGYHPYGQVGDLLWVRETWIDTFIPHTTPVGGFYYKADHPEEKSLRWKPSIHMPKSAARIWLKITNVKAERLQEISSRDAILEGIENLSIEAWKDYISPLRYCSNPRDSFCSLWISINGNESWEADPWVWAIEFEVLSTTGKPAAL